MSTTSGHGLVPLQSLKNLAPDFMFRFVMTIRIILKSPGNNTPVVSHLSVKQIQPSTGLLGHPGDLLQQITEILDVPGLFAQESSLDSIHKGSLSAFLGHPAQPFQIFQESLLDGECFPARLDRLDWRVRPLYLGRLDGCRPASATARDHILLQPVEVDQALFGASFPEPVFISMLFIWMGKDDSHCESMKADVRPGAIGSELPVKHPGTQLLVDVASHGLSGQFM